MIYIWFFLSFQLFYRIIMQHILMRKKHSCIKLVLIYINSSIITEETSKGNMKIISREKYQAINTEIVTIMWCRNTFPYLKSKVPASKNATIISVKNAPRTILSSCVISNKLCMTFQSTSGYLFICIVISFRLLSFFDFDFSLSLHLLQFLQGDWF